MGLEKVNLLEVMSKYTAELGQSPDLYNCKAVHYFALWLLLPAPGLRPEGSPLEVGPVHLLLDGQNHPENP